MNHDLVKTPLLTVEFIKSVSVLKGKIQVFQKKSLNFFLNADKLELRVHQLVTEQVRLVER